MCLRRDTGIDSWCLVECCLQAMAAMVLLIWVCTGKRVVIDRTRLVPDGRWMDKLGGSLVASAVVRLLDPLRMFAVGC